jgi:hypothetical protein
MVARDAARDQLRMEMPMLPLVLSSDSHVFEPPDLWQTRIDAAFRDRAPRPDLERRRQHGPRVQF